MTSTAPNHQSTATSRGAPVTATLNRLATIRSRPVGTPPRKPVVFFHAFSNRVRLALFVLAHDIGNFMRRFTIPREVSHWSLSSIQLKLVMIGAKIISHSRKTVFQCDEVAVPEKLFRSMLARIHRLGRACARAPALSL